MFAVASRDGFNFLWSKLFLHFHLLSSKWQNMPFLRNDSDLVTSSTVSRWKQRAPYQQTHRAGITSEPIRSFRHHSSFVCLYGEMLSYTCFGAYLYILMRVCVHEMCSVKDSMYVCVTYESQLFPVLCETVGGGGTAASQKTNVIGRAGIMSWFHLRSDQQQKQKTRNNKSSIGETCCFRSAVKQIIRNPRGWG